MLTMLHQWDICQRSPSKMNKMKSTDSYRGILFCQSSNNTPSSPPYHIGSIRKALTEVQYDDELTAGIGD